MLDSKIVMYAALALLVWFMVFKKKESYDEDYDEDYEEDYESEDSDDE